MYLLKDLIYIENGKCLERQLTEGLLKDKCEKCWGKLLKSKNEYFTTKNVQTIFKQQTSPVSGRAQLTLYSLGQTKKLAIPQKFKK
jgi:hypothetical protein